MITYGCIHQLHLLSAYSRPLEICFRIKYQHNGQQKYSAYIDFNVLYKSIFYFRKIQQNEWFSNRKLLIVTVYVTKLNKGDMKFVICNYQQNICLILRNSAVGLLLLGHGLIVWYCLIQFSNFLLGKEEEERWKCLEMPGNSR